MKKLSAPRCRTEEKQRHRDRQNSWYGYSARPFSGISCGGMLASLFLGVSRLYWTIFSLVLTVIFSLKSKVNCDCPIV